MFFKKYKLSQYNRLVIDGDLSLLYNQASGILLKLNDRLDEFCAIKGEVTCLNRFKKLLRKHGFLIPVEQNDFDILKEKWKKIALDEKNKHFVIAITSRCNSNCFYCYEQNCLEQKRVDSDMSSEVQKQLIEFTDRCLSSTPTTVFRVTWFGGEPLLRFDIIEHLSERFAKLCEKNGCEYRNDIITNGTLLDESTVDALVSMKCRRIQITVDGFREVHDKRRPLLCGESSYDKIMEGMDIAYRKGMSVVLRTNIDRQNSKNYIEFLEHIISRGYTKRNDAGGIVNPGPSICRWGNRLGMSHEEFAAVANKSLEVLRYHREFSPLEPTMGGCMVHGPFLFSISPTGSIVNCLGHVLDEHGIGTIYDTNIAEQGTPVKAGPWEDPVCKNCPVLPSCGGGCIERHEHFVDACDKDCGRCNSHYSGCQTVRWNLDQAIIALYHYSKTQRQLQATCSCS